MTVTDALNARRTIRSFTPDRLDREQLLKILEPALRAPSWANTQPWEIFVAAGEPLERIRRAYAENLKNCVPRDPDVPLPKDWPADLQRRMDMLRAERLAALEQECRDRAAIPDLMQMNYRLFNAPVVLYLCIARGLTPWSMFDLGALSQSIMLAAQEQGTGSAVAVTLAAHPDVIRRELSVPEDLLIVIGIALGHPDPDDPQNKFRSTRRPPGEAVRFKGM